MVDEFNADAEAVIDADGIEEFVAALGITDVTLDIPLVLADLEAMGFLVINPDAMFSQMGFADDEIDALREDMENLGLDPDDVFGTLADPNAKPDMNAIYDSFDGMSPKEVQEVLDEMEAVFGTTVTDSNTDFAADMEKMLKDIEKDQAKREKKTKEPKQVNFRFESAPGGDSTAASCSGTIGGDASMSFYLGVVEKTTWDNPIVVGYGKGLCGANNDELNVYDVTVELYDSDGTL